MNRPAAGLGIVVVLLLAVGCVPAAAQSGTPTKSKPAAPARFLPTTTDPAKVTEHPVSLSPDAPASQCLECHSGMQTGKYVHAAMSMGCTTCHNISTADGVTHVTLTLPVNQLCEKCHPLSNEKVLHGPYKEGLCVVCHSPHSSDFPNHTLATAQDICLGCHARARLKMDQKAKTVMTPWGWKLIYTDQKTDTVTTPWDKTLTFPEMKGWTFLNLNATLTANHPVAGHPITGPNLQPGMPPVSCQSCHKNHASQYNNLLTAGALPSMPGCPTCGVCKQCHESMF